ncbi:MAG: beta-galactosidase [Lachnospiraceae bacterium]|nr:beta-galactosidase [Lachnospiraceae bacterium]
MSKSQTFQWNEMTMGVCYYPEHWPQKLWAQDLERMLDAGITVIRIAEFAWNKVEPQEGVFTFEFFEQFLNLCAKKGMKVIFGTPSATPPAWLTEKYPEVLNCDEAGVPYRHGGRRHYNYNSSIYRELAARIVEQLGAHYGKHPAIAGWQIDNEINCEICEFHSEADMAAFRVFLQKKYGTLDELNEAWGTTFWNQTYTDWQQVRIPGPLLNDGYNPHQHLDYYRFISESALSFCKMQADILRRYKKEEDFITTNGIFWNMDNHCMAEESLDVYTYDSYPNFAFSVDADPLHSTDLNDRHWSKNLAEVRSVCPHFGIMEQQSGANGWTTRMEAPAPRPGQLTLWAMQSVAQGADYISFFRWRTCCIGTEIYWHGILDYDNRDNRKLAEVKAFYRKFRKLDALCGSEFTAAFGFLKDYDNEWDTNVDKWHRRIASASEKAIFEASELTHTPYDYLYLRENTTVDELSRYPVLIYPHPVIMTEARAALLGQYVEQGGTLILGCRSGYKQENGKCVMLPQPGLLQALTGTDVRDFTFTSPAEEPVYASWEKEMMDVTSVSNTGWMEKADPEQIRENSSSKEKIILPLQQSEIRTEMPVFNDIFELADADAKVLAVYSNSYYAGKAAVMEKKTGCGRTIHLGSVFSREIVKLLLKYTGVISPFDAVVEAPEGVEVVQRKKGGSSWLFVLNFQAVSQTITLKKSMWSVFEECEVSGEKNLAPFEVEVFEEK